LIDLAKEAYWFGQSKNFLFTKCILFLFKLPRFDAMASNILEETGSVPPLTTDESRELETVYDDHEEGDVFTCNPIWDLLTSARGIGPCGSPIATLVAGITLCCSPSFLFEQNIRNGPPQ
jgi:hypothetical protein